MSPFDQIPNFALFGESESFPDIVHVEKISDRARGHGWNIRPHRHQKMAQVVLVEDGEAEANVDGFTLGMQPGSFLFLPAGHVHGFRFSAGTEGVVLSCPEGSLARIGPVAGGAALLPAAPALGQADRATRDIIRLLEECLASPGLHRDEVALGLTQAILAKVAAAAKAANQASGTLGARLARLDRLIVEHLEDDWRPRDFANALSVSTGHLSRICRAAHGVGLRAYLDAAVMKEAARNLAFTRLPVAEIGYRLGYADPTHFSRRFRAVVGQTPTDYRKKTNAPSAQAQASQALGR